jgi:HK97 family phage major capsid protein
MTTTRPSWQNFSLSAEIEAIANNRGQPCGWTAEVTRDFEKQLGITARGTLIPLGALAPKTRAQVAGTDTAGGFTVGQSVGEYIDFLRADSIVLASGAQVVVAKADENLPYPASGTSMGWLPELGEASLSDLTIGAQTLTPHRCSGGLSFSRQFAVQSGLADEVITRELRQAMGAAIDLAALDGSGETGEPMGIFHTSAVPSVSFGGAATRSKLVDMEFGCTENGRESAPLTWCAPAAVRKKFRTVTDGTGFLWSDENKVLGIGAKASGNVPATRICIGDFSQITVAFFGGLLDLVVDVYTGKKADRIEVLGSTLADVAVRRATSFCVSADSALA